MLSDQVIGIVYLKISLDCCLVQFIGLLMKHALSHSTALHIILKLFNIWLADYLTTTFTPLSARIALAAGRGAAP